MKQPEFTLVVDHDQFYIHELNEFQQNRVLLGPFDSMDSALRSLWSFIGKPVAIPLVVANV